MNKSIARGAVGTLVCAVAILTLVGLFGIWGWVGEDVVWKSYSTIGVVALAAFLVVGIAQITGKYAGTPPAPAPESPVWKAARNLLLGAIGIVFLAFAALAIAAIWNFVGPDTLWRSFSSMMLLFTSGVITLVAFKQVD